MVYESDDSKDWNFNMAWLQRLNQNLMDCDTLMKQGNGEFLYRALLVVYNQMHWRLIQSGKADEEKIEKELKDKLSLAENMFKNRVFVQGAATQAEILLQEIHVLLSDLVYEYGFIQLTGKKVNPETAIEDEMG